MSSSSALKFKIAIKPSYHAGVSLFLLYSFVISLAFFVTPLTTYSFIPYLLLFLVALRAAIKAYNSSEELLVSESGFIEKGEGDTYFQGQICATSFYNHCFIFLKLKKQDLHLADNGKNEYMTIYRDAVSDAHFRLLARLIRNEQK